MDRHKLPAGVRDFDPDLGRIVRPDWSQATPDALLRRLYHPLLSAFHDGVLGERYAGVDRPDGDDRISVILFRRMPCSLFRTPPDPRALHRVVNRLQHRGGGIRRVRALHRDLADRCDRQQLGTILLSHRGGDDHVPRRAQNPREGVQAVALICSSSGLLFAAMQMSAFGTKRTYRGVCCLSAFGGKRKYALALNGHIEPTCACPLWRAKADFGARSVMTRS